MPLREHFRPPLSVRRHWHGFHSAWCQPLPVLPLWLRGGLSLRVDLEATYERTCREQRISKELA